MSVVYEIENKGKRMFTIGVDEHVSGARAVVGMDGKMMHYVIEPGATVKVNDKCGDKLSNGWKGEIKVLRKINRKD